jgi:hypothetical protein
MKTPTTTTTTPKAKPRFVNFALYDEDYECAFLGAMGFSTRYISTQTHLGGGQVNYRLKKAHIRRMDYRNGTSAFAQIMLQSRPRLQRELNSQLKLEKLI